MDKTTDLTYRIESNKISKQMFDIDYTNSKHVKSLQNSNYICIDHESQNYDHERLAFSSSD